MMPYGFAGVRSTRTASAVSEAHVVARPPLPPQPTIDGSTPPSVNPTTTRLRIRCDGALEQVALHLETDGIRRRIALAPLAPAFRGVERRQQLAAHIAGTRQRRVVAHASLTLRPKAALQRLRRRSVT